jgi:hypothetical protein
MTPDKQNLPQDPRDPKKDSIDSIGLERVDTNETMIDGEIISPKTSVSRNAPTKSGLTDSYPHDPSVPMRRKNLVLAMVVGIVLVVVITVTTELSKKHVPSRPSSEQLINTLNPTSNVSTNDENYMETYIPGNLTRQEVGLVLSEGLRARIIATSGTPVQYHDGTFSAIPFHGLPDFGATFRDTRPFNDGGWVYASNSEMKEEGQGGVGSLTFDKEGNIIDYRMVLQNTTMNCGGGSTPWYVVCWFPLALCLALLPVCSSCPF